MPYPYNALTCPRIIAPDLRFAAGDCDGIYISCGPSGSPHARPWDS